jgi:predicted peroxiredoxin
MAKFLFVLSRGTEDPARATRCFQLAKVAREGGHEVNVFLVDEGVVLARAGMADHVKAASGDELKPYMDFLVKERVPIYV